MRTLVLGDIHGRKNWRDIVDAEKYDKVVFLGDYVSSHEDVSEEDQISNLKDILEFKKNNFSKVILLRGNHDMQALGYYWAECYPVFRDNWLQQNMSEFLNCTQWLYTQDSIIFSHAGISQEWYDTVKRRALIHSIEEINDLPPSELFGFTPNRFSDTNGISTSQPLTWIRPSTLSTCAVEGTHIVGHTPVKVGIVHLKDYVQLSDTVKNNDIWLCDALGLGQYLIIDDNKFEMKTYGKYK